MNKTLKLITVNQIAVKDRSSSLYSTLSSFLFPLSSYRFCRFDSGLFTRGPKIFVPIRIKVAPSAIAASKSPLIPMESSMQLSKPLDTKLSLASRSCWNCCRCTSNTSVGAGMAISPERISPGSSLHSTANCPSSSGATPDLLSSPLIFTCSNIFNGAKVAGRCSLRRWAIFNRSTLCTQWKFSAMEL